MVRYGPLAASRSVGRFGESVGPDSSAIGPGRKVCSIYARFVRPLIRRRPADRWNGDRSGGHTHIHSDTQTPHALPHVAHVVAAQFTHSLDFTGVAGCSCAVDVINTRDEVCGVRGCQNGCVG